VCSDGRSVEHRGTTEIARAITELQALHGKPAVRQVRIETSKGLGTLHLV
jgi:hypothetical protein